MTKSKPQVKIVDCTTGEEIVRDANAEEIAQMKTQAENDAIAKAEAETKATAKAAILQRIGLTADELQTILG
jgi:DNA-binding protein YbaB